MAGGPIFPSSTYFGDGAGVISPMYYIPATNTNTAGAIEGCGVVASLAADTNLTMQFNLPEVIPAGTLKLRTLIWANATTGNAQFTVSDGQTAPGSNIGATTLTAEGSQGPITWTAADVLVEKKTSLTTVPVANDILTIQVVFKTSGWTLAQVSVWQFSLVWE